MLHSFHYNNTKYTADETNILIGSAIVRQVRVHSGKYNFVWFLYMIHKLHHTAGTDISDDVFMLVNSA